jgi:hypothetical protein
MFSRAEQDAIREMIVEREEMRTRIENMLERIRALEVVNQDAMNITTRVHQRGGRGGRS